MTVNYLELADYLAIAAEVTGLDEETITRVAKVGLADSALHAPAAAFDETEFYTDFVDKGRGIQSRRSTRPSMPSSPWPPANGPRTTWPLGCVSA